MKTGRVIFSSVLFLLIVLQTLSTKAQLIVRKDRTATQLVENVLIGGGIQILSVQTSSSANSIGFFDGRNSNIGLDSGIVLSTGNVSDATGPNNATDKSSSNNQPGDPALDKLSAPYPTYDASFINVTFVPQSNSIRFRFVFASEEYPESVSQNYNDVFGFFISGPGFTPGENLALVPGTSTPVSIKTINANTNSTYYIDNTNGTSVQFDAFTRVIEITGAVVPCETYNIVIAVADVNDFVYDSGIFIEAQSFQSANEATVSIKTSNPDIQECDSSYFLFTRNSTDISQPMTIKYRIEGTAMLGSDFVAFNPDSIIIPAGQKNAAIKVLALEDGSIEPKEDVILTIIEPNTCGVIKPESIGIRDFRPQQKIVTKVNCAGSRIVVIIENDDAFDSTKWFDSQHNLIGIAYLVDVPRVSYTVLYVEAIEKCSGTVFKDSVIIRVYDITSNNDTTVCPGDTVDLVATSSFSGALYDWEAKGATIIPGSNSSEVSVVVTETTLVTVVMANDGVCAYQEIIIIVPELSVSSLKYQICFPDSVQIQASGGNTYKWTPSTGLSSDTISNPVAKPTQTTTYRVDIGSGTCGASFDVEVIVDTMPEAFAGEDLLICSRQIIRLEGRGSDYGTYEWSPVTGLDSPLNYNPLANPISTTTYYLKALNGSCFAYDTIIIFVADSVSSDFIMNYDSCSRIIHLYNPDSLRNTTFYWDLGDGTISNSSSVVHRYQTDGTYLIRHITNREAPCINEKVLTVGAPEIDSEKRRIPNAFTPNGDGVDDVFRITGGPPACVIEQLLVFDRWGKVVFDSKKSNVLEWDGYVDGTLVTPGIYVYIAKGENFTDKGSIAVVR